MIEIVSGTKTLRISPFERQDTPEAPMYDWIRTYIEYSLPELNVQYQAAFTVWELSDLKEKLCVMQQNLLKGIETPDANFDSLERQLNIHFITMRYNAITVELTLRPENNAESVIVKDILGIDQSYLSALLSGLDEMINWVN